MEFYFRTLCAGMRTMIEQACDLLNVCQERRILAFVPVATLAGCLAPEPPNQSGGANATVNVYYDDTAADADTDTGETGDTSDPSETGETGDTGDSGDSGDSGDTGDTGLDTADETGDTGGDTGSVDTAGDTAGDTASDTGETGTVDTAGDTGGADTSTDTAADTADTGTDPVVTWYADSDGDGYGDDSVTVDSSTAPSGYVSIGGDCDDSDATVNPGASELPVNGTDEDCSGYDAALLVTAFHDEVTQDGTTMASGYDQWVWYGASEDGVNNVSWDATDLPSALDSSDTLESILYWEDVDSVWGGHPWLEYTFDWDSNGDGVEESWGDDGCDGWSFTITASEPASVGTAYAYNWTDGSSVAYGNCSLYVEGNSPTGSDVGQVFEFAVP